MQTVCMGEELPSARWKSNECWSGEGVYGASAQDREWPIAFIAYRLHAGRGRLGGANRLSFTTHAGCAVGLRARWHTGERARMRQRSSSPQRRRRRHPAPVRRIAKPVRDRERDRSSTREHVRCRRLRLPRRRKSLRVDRRDLTGSATGSSGR